MSIFSRLRKRDSDETVPPEAASTAKKNPPATVSPPPPPPGKGGAPTSAKAAAVPLPPPFGSAEETTKKAAPQDETKPPPSRPAKGSGGMTRAYHAVGTGAVPAPRHPVPVSTGAATTKGPPPRPPAGTMTDGAALSPSEVDAGGARGAVSRNGAGSPKATNVANGVLGDSRNALSAVADNGAPREPATEIGSVDQAFEALFPRGDERDVGQRGRDSASDQRCAA